MAIIIYGIAFVLGGFAFLFLLTPATEGVGAIAFAILLAVLARMVQASAHHHAIMMIGKPETIAPEVAVTPPEPLPRSIKIAIGAAILLTLIGWAVAFGIQQQGAPLPLPPIR